MEIWGSGEVKREFLNVMDLAKAVVFLLKKKINYDYLNIGSGEEFSIKDIAKIISRITNYNGKILFNRNYPDGVKHRKLNSSKIKKMGWSPKIKLREGLQEYCLYYINRVSNKKSFKI